MLELRVGFWRAGWWRAWAWGRLIEWDCGGRELSAIGPHGGHAWRSDVRSAMSAASQLSGRGPAGVDVASVPAR